MNQENVNKLVDWIKNNQNYSTDDLQKTALQGGASEEEIKAALAIINNKIETLQYKGVGIRFFALILDLIVIGILFWIFKMIFPGTYIGGCSSSFQIGSTVSIMGNETFYGLCGFPALLFFLIVFAYYVLLEWKLGGTLGKLAIGARVKKITGESIDLKASLIRNIMRIVDFLPLFYLVGAISIWNSKTKQRLGDRLAKTVVVSK